MSDSNEARDAPTVAYESTVASLDLSQQRIFANLSQKLFAVEAEPARVGRFVIVDRLGAGGMGVVYRAFDPDLERQVALKVLRRMRASDTQAETRLLREAQALARLSHPNVVPVYEVGIIDEQVFIVMEFVKGRTLTAWVDEERPSWRAVLDVYQQAGRGLMAAHEADMVHRDFKPDNVQIGDDGRVRVLDFGIVMRQSSARPTRASSGAPPRQLSPREPGPDDVTSPGTTALKATREQTTAPLTQTGAIIGTPAFMSPEQFRGERADAKSDQFGFCASLYHSLYDQRAFAGKSFQELSANVREGRLEPPPRAAAVPGWLFAVIRRGLSAEPDERYPSMEALLRALANHPARKWRRVALAAVLVGMLGLTILGLTRPRAAAISPCRFDSRELAGIWDTERRQTVRGVLDGLGSEYATRARSRIEDDLDGYGQAWLEMRIDACEAHQRGEQSGALLDRRIACLDDHRAAMSSAVTVLTETDEHSVSHAVDVAQQLPALSECADIERLMAEVEPPENPTVARQVGDAHRRLRYVQALQHAGRYDEALAGADELVALAEPLAYAPLSAHVQATRGHLLLSRGERRRAIEPLRLAVQEGLASGVDDVALEALARLIYVQGLEAGDADAVLGWLFLAESLNQRRGETGFEYALLLNNAGAVWLSKGQRERARQSFEAALTVRPSTFEGRHIELVNIWLNLVFVTDRPGERLDYRQRAVRAFTEQLGEEHPLTLQASLGTIVAVVDPRASRLALQRTCELYERYHPGIANLRSECLYLLGFLDAELGDHQAAAEVFQRAAAAYGQQGGAREFQELAAGFGHLYGGQHQAAISAFEVAADDFRQRQETHPWTRAYLGHALLGLGTSLWRRGDPGDAASASAALEQSVAALTGAAGEGSEPTIARRLAQALYTLASALQTSTGVVGGHGDATRRRIHDLRARAETIYLGTAAGQEEAVRELEPWRLASPSQP